MCYASLCESARENTRVAPYLTQSNIVTYKPISHNVSGSGKVHDTHIVIVLHRRVMVHDFIIIERHVAHHRPKNSY